MRETGFETVTGVLNVVPWRRNLTVCLLGSFTTILAMTMLLPFLPLYVQKLGVGGEGSIARWSGYAYSATFLAAGISAPVWGRLGDRFGRKQTLVRAGFGMAGSMALLGVVQSVEQLVAVRFLAGIVGGFASGATILVAEQTPENRRASALGILSMGVMSGNIAGPILGGYLPQAIGIRESFFCAGALIFVAAIGVVLFLVEGSPVAPSAAVKDDDRAPVPWIRVTPLLVSASLVLFATTSIEPILTLLVGSFGVHGSHVAQQAGFVFTATAIGSVLAAPLGGKAADLTSPQLVMTCGLAAGGLLAFGQYFAHDAGQLVVLRFVMGLALGGVLPSLMSAVRGHVSAAKVGRILGLSMSAQFAGQVLGPLAGGEVANAFNPRSVFVMTGAILILVAAAQGLTLRRQP